MSSRKNIFDVIQQNLCCGCGACVGVCPKEALEIDSKKDYKPKIYNDLCVKCGLCYEVCPGKGYNVYEMSQKKSYGNCDMSRLFGPVINSYIGSSKDKEIKKRAASGGIATTLLIHLLKTKQVDSVSTIVMEDGYPTVKLTNDVNIVLKGAESKYSPVPLMKIIKELKKSSQKVALTVTPCQLAALNIASKKIKELNDKVVITIGLFCGHVKEYESVSMIASSMGIKYPGEAKFLGWRSGAYPGNARFELIDGSYKDKPLYPWLDIAISNYALKRCFLCPDGGNWLSDITLGDVHSSGYDETVIVSRSKKGEELLQEASNLNKIKLRTLSNEEKKRTVISGIVGSKLVSAIGRIEYLKRKNKNFPKFDYPVGLILRDVKKSTIHIQILRYKLSMLIRKKIIRKVLKKYPFLMEKVGHFLYKFPKTIPFYGFFRRVKNFLIGQKL